MKTNNALVARMLNVGRAGLLLSLGATLFLGCGNTIRVPAEDTTPPEIALQVLGFEDEIRLTPETPAVTIEGETPRNGVISLLAVANDEDGAVRNVRLDGEVLYVCQRGEERREVNRAVQAENPDTAVPGEQAQTRRATGNTLRLASFREDCPTTLEESTLRGITLSVSATGENFHGGTATTAFFTFSLTFP